MDLVAKTMELNPFNSQKQSTTPKTEDSMREAILKNMRCWVVTDENGKPISIWVNPDFCLASLSPGWKVGVSTWGQAIKELAKSAK